jgi:virginiamycin B lyase
MLVLTSGSPGKGSGTFNLVGSQLCFTVTGPAGSHPSNAKIVRTSTGNPVVTLFATPQSAFPVKGCVGGISSTLADEFSTNTTAYSLQVQTSSGTLTGVLHNRFTAFAAKVSLPARIVEGPDGNLWFTDEAAADIGRITPLGVVKVYPVAAVKGPGTEGITVGPDGALWFTITDFGYSGSPPTKTYIGRSTTSGNIKLFPLPSGSSPYGLVFGPDGAVWYTDPNSNTIGRLTLDGHVTQFAIPTAGSNPLGIARGADGNLWFVENVTGGVARITPSGVIKEFPAPNPSGSIVAGPDGNIWFADFTDVIYRITPAGVETTFPISTSINSYPNGLVFDATGRLVFAEAVLPSSHRLEFIGRLAASTKAIARFYLAPPRVQPFGITVGPHADIWFTEYNASQIGRMFPDPAALGA